MWRFPALTAQLGGGWAGDDGAHSLACEDIFARRDSAIPIFKTLKAKGPFMKLLMDQKPNVKEYLLDEVDEPEKELKEFLEKEGLGQLNE